MSSKYPVLPPNKIINFYSNQILLNLKNPFKKQTKYVKIELF